MITRGLAASSLLLAVAACDLSAGPAKADENQAEADPAPSLEPSGWVTDEAELLSSEDETALTAKLEEIERSTQHQIVIVTVSSLGGQDVAGFTDALGNAWGVGREGYNDGAVILVAPNERKARISVADGLLRAITNDESRRIMDELMLPNFKAGRFYRGLDASIDAIASELNSDPPAE